MKRLKFLPSVLMLVLCVGVLCMGIYAASPNSNQITGSITINPANASVDITAWAENYDGSIKSTPITKEGLRTGEEVFDFTNEAALRLDYSSANYVCEVKPCYIKIQIKNNSSKELGAYISTEKVTKEEAGKTDIFTSDDLENSDGNITLTSMAFYTHMGVANTDDADLTDTALLVLEFKAKAFMESADSISFENYYVNIEEYIPNAEEAVVTDFSNGFVKLSSTIKSTGEARTEIDGDTGFYGIESTAVEDLWVVVPNGVKTVGGFSSCTALTQLTLPESTTTIVNGGFRETLNLKSMVIPRSMGAFSIGIAFMNVPHVRFYVDPSNVAYSSDAQGALYNKDKTQIICGTNIESFVIPDSVKSVMNLFPYCDKISSLYIPSGSTFALNGGHFLNCLNIKFTVNSENTAYTADEQGALYNKDKTKLLVGSGSQFFNVPDSVSEIGLGAFYGRANLVKITIPSSVTNIGESAFYGCTTLAQVNFSGTKEEFNAKAYASYVNGICEVVCTDGTIAKTA